MGDFLHTPTRPVEIDGTISISELLERIADNEEEAYEFLVGEK